MTGIDAIKTRDAAIWLAAADTDVKNGALRRIAKALLDNKSKISEANKTDEENAKNAGLPEPIIKRLMMDEHKVESVADGIYSLIELDDPVGKQLLATELADGLILKKISCPIGVIGVIFESRPDALVQIACLCLKSGNAVILKGGSEAAGTNRLLAALIKEATCGACGNPGAAAQNNYNPLSVSLPPEWINQLETRAEISDILKMDDLVDLLIPRGSNEFVKYIMDNTRIPVIGHSDGICHCYVDKSADPDMAVKIVTDAKTQYVAVCNATETLLVHRDAAQAVLPALCDALNCSAKTDNDKPYVRFKCCAKTMKILANRPVEAATEYDWGAEYLDYILAIKIVDSLDEAINHINRYGSRHTDAIITNDAAAAEKFMLLVDSANVYHNCSTRFSDGFRYGFGAEVGVSTSKIHARGPVGLEGMVTYKYLLSGGGDIVADFEEGRRKFTHRDFGG